MCGNGTPAKSGVNEFNNSEDMRLSFLFCFVFYFADSDSVILTLTPATLSFYTIPCLSKRNQHTRAGSKENSSSEDKGDTDSL